MKKMSFKRKLAGIICICLAGTLMLTGCNKDKEGNDASSSSDSKSAVNSVSDNNGGDDNNKNTPLSTDIEKDCIYHESQTIEVPEGYEMNGSLCIAGEKIYMQGTKYSEDYTKVLESNVFELDMSGNVLNTIPIELGENTNISTNISVDGDGNICFVTYHYEPYEEAGEDGEAVEVMPEARAENNAEDIAEDVDENSSDEENSDIENAEDNSDDDISYEAEVTEQYSLVMIDKDGNKVLDKDISEYAEEQDYFYVNNVSFGSDGNIYIQNDFSVIVLDKSGNELFKLENNGDISYIQSMIRTNENKFAIVYYDTNGKFCMNEIDSENKKLGEKKTIDSALTNGVNGFLNGSGEYTFYMFDSNSMYGVNIATGESKKIINWIDSDIDSSNIQSVSALADGKFIISSYDSTDWKNHISVIEKTDADTIKNQQVITLAGNYLDSRIYSEVIKFNKENQNYRIKVTDYSEYSTEDDWNAGATKFKADMTTGNVPDIIVINNDMSVETLSSKGILADINEFFNKDSEIKREDYLENIFKAFESEDGKLYSIAPSFNISTLVGKTSNLEGLENWSLSKFIDYAENLDEEQSLFSPDSMTSDNLFYILCYNAINDFVDFENKTCDFNNEGFIKLLEFAKKYPTSQEYYENFDEDMDYDAYYQDIYLGYRNGKIILENSYFYDLGSMYQIEKADFGDDVLFIGYPSNDGSSSYINADLKFGISAKSDNQEAAWQFIKHFLSDEYQEMSGGLPVKKSALEKKAKDAMTPYTYTDENGETVVEEPTIGINGMEFKIGYMDEEHKNKYMDFISSLDKESSYNSEITAIIDEEVQAFFSGQKSAQETADIIQNRVKTYINETF